MEPPDFLRQLKTQRLHQTEIAGQHVAFTERNGYYTVETGWSAMQLILPKLDLPEGALDKILAIQEVRGLDASYSREVGNDILFHYYPAKIFVEVPGGIYILTGPSFAPSFEDLKLRFSTYGSWLGEPDGL